MTCRPPLFPLPQPPPWGHSAGAHILLGFCADCPGRDLAHEVNAWRSWSVVHVPAVLEALP